MPANVHRVPDVFFFYETGNLSAFASVWKAREWLLSSPEYCGSVNSLLLRDRFRAALIIQAAGRLCSGNCLRRRERFARELGP